MNTAFSSHFLAGSGDQSGAPIGGVACLNSSPYSHRVRFAPEDGGGDPPPNNPPSNPPQDITKDPRVQAMIEQHVQEATKGLVKNRNDLLDENKKFKERYAALGDRDPEQIAQMLKQIEQDEDAQLVASGKIDDVVQKRIRAALDSHQQQMSQAQQALEQITSQANDYKSRFLDLTLSQTVAKEAARVGADMTALDDLQAHVGRYFDVLEDGNVVLKENAQLFDKQGTPHTLRSYFDSLHEARPYFFPPSSGGGAKGGGGGRMNLVSREQAASGMVDLEKLASGEARIGG